MKLHLSTDNKTVAVEGTVKLADLFNRLMSWFPEDWEQWELIEFVPTIKYKELIVEKEVWKNPYWNPYQKFYYNNVGNDTGNAIPNTIFTVSPTVTLNCNNL